MKKQELIIAGMTCNHCIMAVKKGLANLTGVTVADVQIGKANIEVNDPAVTDQQIKQAIENAGYQLLSVVNS